MHAELTEIIAALRRVTPDLLRWGGTIARRMRGFEIGLSGKSSGNSNTDALTLADLTVQELIIAGLRDREPLLRSCRIEAEEANGDLAAFASDSPFSIALDPIDGTKYFQNRSSSAYAVMIHLRTLTDVLYSLVYAPEDGPTGTWMQAYGQILKCGPDDPSIPAAECLHQMPDIDVSTRPDSNKIYLIGFQKNDRLAAKKVTSTGLAGFAPDDMPGSIYPLLASGQFGGSLIHTPNIYDYPVSLQIARIAGGDSVWVHNGQPVNFSETWMDDRADMLRLPGIVATADSPEKLRILVELARDWDPRRYEN
jgi:3'(2'), 5'-bisphosphate nucleotidase